MSLTLNHGLKAAGNATKHEPPNTPDFDGVRDGQLSDVKPHGHTGCAASTSSSTTNTTALLKATILPPLTNHLAPNTYTLSAITHSHAVPSTPPHAKAVIMPLSPTPDVGLELHACIGDFLRSKGIDLSGSLTALMDLELTPDIVSDVPVARLCEVMGAVEGKVHKFQVFCKVWNVHLEDKKQRTL
jgi:hypothetical protein